MQIKQNKNLAFGMAFEIDKKSFSNAPKVLKELNSLVDLNRDKLNKATKGTSIIISAADKHATSIKLTAFPNDLRLAQKAKFHLAKFAKKVFQLTGTAFNERKIPYLDFPTVLVTKASNVAKEAIKGFKNI